ncbi:hypothetical protein E6C60_3196 [Paenibacillus algicola]|uniref:Uncharacterized protein n=1 Tax=Paenibacillus algicola TaxID=2565926 RepID=A0A4P8XM76_9BACL|nr:hypothetical protein E6C60_3196 [Paenibacillus algicola]
MLAQEQVNCWSHSVALRASSLKKELQFILLRDIFIFVVKTAYC